MRRTKRWDVLEDLARERECRLGVEVGVYTGTTFFRLLDRCPDLVMVGVDHWQPYDGCPYTDLNAARDRVLDGAIDYGPRATILPMDSVDAARQMFDRSVDFVFIDADHSTEAVQRDIDAWRPKIKPDGFMAGHDIDWGSVRDAVDQNCRVWSTLPDDVWFCERANLIEPQEAVLARQPDAAV